MLGTYTWMSLGVVRLYSHGTGHEVTLGVSVDREVDRGPLTHSEDSKGKWIQEQRKTKEENQASAVQKKRMKERGKPGKPGLLDFGTCLLLV